MKNKVCIPYILFYTNWKIIHHEFIVTASLRSARSKAVRRRVQRTKIQLLDYTLKSFAKVSFFQPFSVFLFLLHKLVKLNSIQIPIGIIKSCVYRNQTNGLPAPTRPQKYSSCYFQNTVSNLFKPLLPFSFSLSAKLLNPTLT
jgi:hypothetical protein